MDLKKEFIHRNIKQEAESEPYNPDTFTASTTNVLKIKFEDSSYVNHEAHDQIENELDAIINAGQPSQLKECKAIPLTKPIETMHKSFEKQICRLCARLIAGDEIFLYQNSDLEQKINYALPITAGMGDGLPEYICSGCESNLNMLYDFVCQVVDADKTIKARMTVPDVKNSDVTNETIKQIFGADPSELMPQTEFEEAANLTTPIIKEGLQEKKPNKQYLLPEDELETPNKIQKVNQDIPIQQEPSETKHRYKCQHCDLDFPDYFGFIHHNRQSHRIVHYPCPEIGCPESFTVEKSLRQHIKENHNVPVICYKCGKIFAYQEALQKHKVNMHFFKVCDDCGMSFKCLVAFKAHQSLHEEVDKYQCVYCHKSLKNRLKLHRHTRQSHSGRFTLLLDTDEDAAMT